MLSVVKCQICNDELVYSRKDPSELIEHIRRKHPLLSQRSRKSSESLKESKERASVDLKNSLKKNSDSLRSLIDREIQTEVDWSFFVAMASNQGEKINLHN